MSAYSQKQIRPTNPFNAIMWIVMLGFAIYLLFFIAKGIFSLLMFATPLMLIASFVLDRSVIINYVKFIFNKIKTEPLMGLGAAALTFVAFPIVSLFVFLKALAKKKIGDKIKDFEQQQQGEYADYKEVEDDFLTLPELEKTTVTSSNKRTKANKKEEESYDDYTEMFE